MPQRYLVLVIVSVATFVASLDLFIVNMAFPSIQGPARLRASVRSMRTR